MLKNLLFAKKKKIRLVVVLLLMLPVLIYATRLIQDIRKQAAGTNEIGIKFSPSTGTYTMGDNINLKIVVENISQRFINISGVQAVFNVGDAMIINNANCLAPFNGLPSVKIIGQQVTVFCAISPGTNPD